MVNAWRWNRCCSSNELSTVSSLDDSKPFITFQASCLNSQVTNINNLSYSLLVKWCTATIGATEISHGPGSPVNLTSDAHKSGNAGMGYAFNLAVVEGYSVGDALMNVRENAELYGRCWYWQNQLGFNLYGDPEVGLYDSDSTNVPTCTILYDDTFSWDNIGFG